MSHPLPLAHPQTAMVSARELKGASLDVVVNILYKISVEHTMPFNDVVPHNGQDLVRDTISLRSALMSNVLIPQIHDHNNYPNESHSDTTWVRWVATTARRTKLDSRLNFMMTSPDVQCSPGS